MTIETVKFLLPEIVIIATAVLIYMGGAFFASAKIWRFLALTGIVLGAACLFSHSGGVDSGRLINDSFALYMRVLVLGLSVLLVLLNFSPLAGGGASEALGSLLLVIAGAMLLATADDLVLLFVSLELISIPTYILLYLGPNNVGKQESAAKYFYLSILASAVLLYGLSFIYGISGTTSLEEIEIAMAKLGALPAGFGNLAKLAWALCFVGLSFRLTAVPGHFYAPDVYQGTTNQNAALLSTIAKAAALVVLLRLFWAALPGLSFFGWPLIVVLSILTMTLGNTLALWQDNLRRLMAYSSIAHAGYLLIGLAAALATRDNVQNSWDGVAGLLFYLCVYAVATLGTFALLESLGRGARRLENVDELSGLAQIRPASAAMMAVFMFSLTGIPPLAGFWGKLYLFGSALSVSGNSAGGASPSPWFIVLAVFGVVNAAISAGYYLRIVGVMYFRKPAERVQATSVWGAWTSALACGLVTIVIGIYPGPLWNASNNVRDGMDRTRISEKTADFGKGLTETKQKPPL